MPAPAPRRSDEIDEPSQRQIGIGRGRRLFEELRARIVRARRRRPACAEQLDLVGGGCRALRKPSVPSAATSSSRVGARVEQRHHRRRRRRLGRAERGEDRATPDGACRRAPPRTRRDRQIRGVAPRATASSRQRVGLPPFGELQPMLDAAQEHVGVGERAMLALGDDAGGTQSIERAQRAALAQATDAPAVHELQRLREELDLANAAGPELDVVARSVGAALGARCAPSSSCTDADRSSTPAVRGQTNGASISSASSPSARSPATARALSQRLPLPRPARTTRSSARRRASELAQRAARALGAQPQVDAKDEAVVGDVADARASRARTGARRTRAACSVAGAAPWSVS